jgi:hypothetical protein
VAEVGKNSLNVFPVRLSIPLVFSSVS